MWVRSQKGKVLVNAVSFEVLDKSLFATCAAGSEVAEFMIGEFATQQDAFAVLDEIQRCIERGSQGVYQVPKQW